MRTNLSPDYLIGIDDIPGMLGMAYKYDQLNRIRYANGFAEDYTAGTSDPGSWSTGGANIYATTYSYDANGNITTLHRSDQLGTLFDKLNYGYHRVAGELVSNRLYEVHDDIGEAIADYDIDDQSNDFPNINDPNVPLDNENYNYRYSALGELIQDSAEKIESIKWRVDSKISEIRRPLGSDEKNLKFNYDSQGNRVAKHVFESNDNWLSSTFYVRDAQGNVMATYEYTTEDDPLIGGPVDTYSLIERPVYGSSRVGMDRSRIEMIDNPGTVSTVEAVSDPRWKTYELSNHLGNVLATFSGRKLPIDNNADGVVDAFHADVNSLTDYYPFGMPMPGRQYAADDYRYGFQGQEKDDEIKGPGNSVNYKYRMHDPRIGRFFAVDPLSAEYPWNSPYAFSENSVIAFVELEGLEKAKIQHKRKKPILNNSFRGGGIPGLFGGTRAKYTKNWTFRGKPNYPEPAIDSRTRPSPPETGGGTRTEIGPMNLGGGAVDLHNPDAQIIQSLSNSIQQVVDDGLDGMDQNNNDVIEIKLDMDTDTFNRVGASMQTQLSNQYPNAEISVNENKQDSRDPTNGGQTANSTGWQVQIKGTPVVINGENDH